MLVARCIPTATTKFGAKLVGAIGARIIPNRCVVSLLRTTIKM